MKAHTIVKLVILLGMFVLAQTSHAQVETTKAEVKVEPMFGCLTGSYNEVPAQYPELDTREAFCQIRPATNFFRALRDGHYAKVIQSKYKAVITQAEYEHGEMLFSVESKYIPIEEGSPSFVLYERKIPYGNLKVTAVLAWRNNRLVVVSTNSERDLATLEGMMKPVDLTLANGTIWRHYSVESLKDADTDFLSVKE